MGEYLQLPMPWFNLNLFFWCFIVHIVVQKVVIRRQIASSNRLLVLFSNLLYYETLEIIIAV